MHPEVFKIGGLVIRSYGIMLAISFIIGLLIAQWQAKQRNLSKEIISDLVMIVLFSAVIGARLFFVVTHLDEFETFWEYFAVWKGGLTFYGGAIFALIAMFIFLRKKAKGQVFEYLDSTAIPIALGEGITRIGCYLNGCCFGLPSGTCGVRFPDGSPAHSTFSDSPIHPTQLYSSLYGILIASILLILDRNFRKYPGLLFWLFTALISTARLIIDFFRYYESTMLVFNTKFSWNQLISVILITLSIIMIIITIRKKTIQIK